MHRVFWLCIIALLGFWAGGTPGWFPYDEAGNVFQSWGINSLADFNFATYATIVLAALLVVWAVIIFLLSRHGTLDHAGSLVLYSTAFAGGVGAGFGWLTGSIGIGVWAFVDTVFASMAGMCVGAGSRAILQGVHTDSPITRD